MIAKKIGFDLDDVLLNFSDALREHMNIKYGESVERKDINSFYIEDFFDITPEEAREVIDAFFLHDDHTQALPMEGAQEVIQRLHKHHTLHIVTAKPDVLRDVTHTWLNKHYPQMFEEVHFGNMFTDRKRRKSEICLELGIDLFIDDAIDNSIDISNAGIPVLLFDTPWNQGLENTELITRVYSWKEIEDKINSM